MERLDRSTTPGAKQSKGWVVASGLCLFAAALFLLRGNGDVAFVVAVLGILAWFANVRASLRSEAASLSTDRKSQKENEKRD